MSRKAHCADCKKELIEQIIHPPYAGTGYARIGKGKRKICYACCGERDEKSMQKHGKATLYVTEHDCIPYSVTNRPNSLKFRVTHYRTGKHNIAGTREDVWFKDKQGAEWHGTLYGSNTQILHCKRLKTG